MLRVLPMIAHNMTYRIQARIPGSTPWQDEGSGDSWDTYEQAERAMARLERDEPANNEGRTIEYRVVECVRAHA